MLYGLHGSKFGAKHMTNTSGRIVFDNANQAKAIDPAKVAEMLNNLPVQLFDETTYSLKRLVTDPDQLRLRRRGSQNWRQAHGRKRRSRHMTKAAFLTGAQLRSSSIGLE
jgi:hypothetical protein